MDKEIRAFADEALAHSKAKKPLIDVRSPGEFKGEITHMAEYPQEGVLRGGHIPGAKSVPWKTAANDDSTFKSAAELAKIYFEGAGLKPGDDTIVYCRIGERSSHTWFVLTYLLGLDKVRNYDGSWTEWGNKVGVPIERSARFVHRFAIADREGRRYRMLDSSICEIVEFPDVSREAAKHHRSLRAPAGSGTARDARRLFRQRAETRAAAGRKVRCSKMSAKMRSAPTQSASTCRSMTTGRAHLRMTLGPEVQTLTRAMTSILCKGLDGATPQEILDLPEDFVTRIVGAELVRVRSQTTYYVLTRIKSICKVYLDRQRAQQVA